MKATSISLLTTGVQVINNSITDNPNSPPKGGNKFTGWLGDSLLSVTGWKFEGGLPQHPKLVLAIAPHTSNWDFFLGVSVLFALRIKIRFLGKHSIFVPVVKQLLELIGGIPVDRKSAHGVVGEVVTQFNAQEKMILAVAPEGTRSPKFPWKTGFLAIAHQAKAPVALIGFDFARKRIVFGPVFLSDGNFDDDMQKVYRFFSKITAKYPENVVFPKEM
jgi:1-acyl-sn-glycerol-3-phosphate acyltransferase